MTPTGGAGTSRAAPPPPVLAGCGVAVAALVSVLLAERLVSSGAPGVAVTRLAVDGLGTLTAGLALLPLLLPGPEHPGRRLPARAGATERARRATLRTAARLAVSAGAGWAIAALLALWLQATDAVGGRPFGVPPGTVLRYAAEVAAGRGLVLTLCCAVLLMVTQWSVDSGTARSGGSHTARYPGLALGIAALGLLAGPVTGHSAGHPGEDPSVIAIALHVVAAGAWVGGLASVVGLLARRPALLAVALPRFSTAAGYWAALVAASGVLSAALRLPTPGALLDTGYGRLVLAKASCLVVLLVAGWHARRRLVPRVTRLAEGPPAGRDRAAPVTRWLVAELTVMAVVFGLAAALAGARSS